MLLQQHNCLSQSCNDSVCVPCRYWAKQLAEQGLVGIILSQSPEFVTPHGATEAIFGTNPFAIGVPSQGGSVVVDMATSATSWFGLVEADRAGQTVADDIGFDADGQPTTDPAAIYKGGSIRVFDRCCPSTHMPMLHPDTPATPVTCSSRCTSLDLHVNASIPLLDSSVKGCMQCASALGIAAR